MSLFDGQDNVFKGACHGATGTLCVLMGAYNSIVYRKRGTTWHLMSAVVYAAMVGLEIVQVLRHRHGEG